MQLVTLAVLFGSGFLWIKFGLRGLSPIQLALAQTAIGAICLYIFMLIGRLSIPRQPCVWGHLAVRAVISNLCPFLLYNWGVQYVASGLAGTLNATAPLFTITFAVIIGMNRFRPIQLLGFLVAFLGVVLLTEPWSNTQINYLVPAAACLAAAAFYGAGYVYAQRFLTDVQESSISMAAGQLTISTLMLGLLTAIIDRRPVSLDPDVIVGALGLGVLSTGVAYTLSLQLIRTWGAAATSAVTYLIPVVAIVLGVSVLNEEVSLRNLAGAMVILVGVALSGIFTAGESRYALR